MHFSLGEKIQGKIAPSPLALAGLMARIPGSHPGYPGYIPGQGIKILLHVTIQCCFTEIKTFSCSRWDLVPWPWLEPRPPALGAWSLSHCTTREVSLLWVWCFLIITPEKAMAPHSSTLAWKIPWMEEPGGLPSMGSHRVGHDWSDLAAAAAAAWLHWEYKTRTSRKWCCVLIVACA